MSLTKGLVGHWRLDEESFNPATKRFTDQSAYCNHGTGNGTQLGSANPGFQADRMGQLVRAAPFNGSDDYISCSNLTGYPNGLDCISLSAWIRFITSQSAKAVVGWWYINNTNIQIDSNKMRFRIYDGVNYDVISDNTLNDDVWHLVTGTYDKNAGGNNILLYIDNVLQTDIDAATGSLSSSDKFNIGTINNLSTGVYNFDGNIADVRIYNRALSQQEITLLYESYRV